jgi:hypothetical protein
LFLNESFKIFSRSHTDILDTSSSEGQTVWIRALRDYEVRLEKTDESIIAIIEEQL